MCLFLGHGRPQELLPEWVIGHCSKRYSHCLTFLLSSLVAWPQELLTEWDIGHLNEMGNAYVRAKLFAACQAAASHADALKRRLLEVRPIQLMKHCNSV